MPTVAIISDIHSNAEALAEVLQDIECHQVDALWCLGDVVGYGHDPVWCLEQVEERADVLLAGNHDLAVAGRIPATWFNGWARAGVEYSRAQLIAAGDGLLDRLGDRRSEVTLRAGSWSPTSGLSGLPNLALAHGCPKPFDAVHDYIESDVMPSELAHELPQAALVAVGHTHRPFIWQCGASPIRACQRPAVCGAATQSFAVAEGSHAVINVGSVGQPRDGDWRACWTQLDFGVDGKLKTVTWRRCEYDIERTSARIAAAHLPQFLADRLAQGR